MDPVGFWSGLGAPASVDWCEPNYATGRYVAEWWNTLSSFALVGMGLVGLVRSRRADPLLERRFVVLWLLLAVVGLGSAAFHATLLRASQAFDELPMFYAISVASYAFAVRAERLGAPSSRRSAFYWGAVALTILFTLAYVALPNHALFIGAYVVLLGYLAAGTARIALSAESSPEFRRLAALTLALNLFAGLGLWTPEHLLLPCDHPLQALALHAVYHVVAGLGTYAWITTLIVDRRPRRAG